MADIASTMPHDFLRMLRPPPGAPTDHLIISPDLATSFYDLKELYAFAYGAGSRYRAVAENIVSGYLEANGSMEVAGRRVRTNAGLRLTRTHLEVAADFQDSEIARNNSYTALLPSFNLVYDAHDNLIVRLSGARTITRPDPPQLIPATRVSSDFAVETGNPALNPFLSDQADLGVEWYFAAQSFVGAAAFYKDISGFIQPSTREGKLGDTGVPISSLDPQISSNATPETPVTITQPENVSESTVIRGLEFAYQQPLSFVVDGLGFFGNYSYIEGKTTFVAGGGAAVPSNLIGLSKHRYNLAMYYEADHISVRASWSYRGDFVTSSCCRNGQPFLRTRQGQRRIIPAPSSRLRAEIVDSSNCQVCLATCRKHSWGPESSLFRGTEAIACMRAAGDAKS